MVFSTGYDMSDDYKFDDGLGQLYTAIAGVWTVLLIIGMAILVYNRKLPFLRIRNLPLTISAVITLHVYWVLCMIAYGLNGHWPCLTEFWIMNIYLPLGIALFHASNAQLLFIAKAQQRYTSFDYIPLEQEKRQKHAESRKGHHSTSPDSRAAQKTMGFIVLGIVMQFVVSIVVFLLSRRFVPDFGVIGDDISKLPLEQSRKLCRQGYEWIPSIAWQFFWAWIYAPYILWNVRHIRDVHGWRLQTICCCLVGLPASPMWLLALYLPQMSPISRYFIPPLWFVPSIFLMEFFMIFAPCRQIIKNRRLKKETLEILAEWERQKNDTSLDSGSTKVGTTSTVSNKASTTNSVTFRKAHSHLFTMTALEKALETNSTPLLTFAALRDFSGENVSFLIAVQEWKRAWLPSRRTSVLRVSPLPISKDPQLRNGQFHRAIEIYATFVSLKFSTYPINISSAHLKKLATIFEETVAQINSNSAGQRNTATPFDEYERLHPYEIELAPRKAGMSTTSTVLDGKSKSSATIEPTRHQASVIEGYRTKSIGEKLPDNMQIPTQFDANVFDEAVDSIKYTVFTNTWPKFVNAGYAASVENGSTLGRFQDHLTEYRTGFARLFSL